MASKKTSSDQEDWIQSAYRYALSLTHQSVDAEDLTQQACLKVLKRNGQLVSKKYLLTTVRHLFVDACRKHRPEVHEAEQTASWFDGKASHVADVDNRHEIEHLLGQLKPEEREVLYLNCVEEYSATEISELTGQPRNTILSTLARVKKRIQQRHRHQSEVET